MIMKKHYIIPRAEEVPFHGMTALCESNNISIGGGADSWADAHAPQRPKF